MLAFWHVLISNKHKVQLIVVWVIFRQDRECWNLILKVIKILAVGFEIFLTMEQSNKMYLFADKADNSVYPSRLDKVRVDALTPTSPVFPCGVIVADTVLNPSNHGNICHMMHWCPKILFPISLHCERSLCKTADTFLWLSQTSCSNHHKLSHLVQ